MTLGLSFLLVVSLMLSAVVSALGQSWSAALDEWLALAQAINLVAGFVIATAVFAMIYKLMPRVPVAWKDIWMGAVVTALLFSAGR